MAMRSKTTVAVFLKGCAKLFNEFFTTKSQVCKVKQKPNACNLGLRRINCAMFLSILIIIISISINNVNAATRNELLDIKIEKQEAGRLIRIQTETAPIFTVFRLIDPMRIVVDISGGSIAKIKGPIDVEDGIVSQIATRQFNANGLYIARVIIGFDSDVPYQVVADGNAVLVTTGAAIKDTKQPIATPVEDQSNRGLLSKETDSSGEIDQNQNNSGHKSDTSNTKQEVAHVEIASINTKHEQVKTNAEIKDIKVTKQDEKAEVKSKKETDEKQIIVTKNETTNTKVKDKSATFSQKSDKKLNSNAKILRCSGVSVSQAAGGTILISLNGEPIFKQQHIDNPPRLVIDLPNTKRNTRRTTYKVNVPWAKRVRLGDHNTTTRVVIDLNRFEIEPKIKVNSKGLSVSISARTSEKNTASVKNATAVLPITKTHIAKVQDVSFERQGNKARIVIKLSSIPTVMVDDRSRRNWVMQLRDTTLPKKLERSLDTLAYATTVKMVSTFQSSQDPPMVNIVANLQGGSQASQKLSQHGKTIVWEIEGQDSKTVATSATPQTAAFAAGATTLANSMPKQSHKRVNMRLKDADLVNVIRFIADVTGENIIVSEAVKGKVTVNLRNVPWEQALDTILKSRGFDKVRHNNIIRISTAAEIQQERERDIAKRKVLIETGETVIRMITINYAIAKELLEKLKPMLSPRGSIQVDDRTNTIVVEDLRDNIKRIVSLARRLDRQTPQVLIEARIVEASSNYIQELGIQWGGTGQASSQYGNSTGLTFPGEVIASGAADDQQTVNTGTINPGRFAVNLPAAIGAGSGGGLGFIFGSAGGGQLLSLRLSALETNGTGRIISSPRIATLDNRTAKIAQGVDIPISTTSAAGTNTRFIPANLELEVTPHVTNDGTVLLRLKTSKNEPDFANRGASGDPTIVKKSAETEVMVRDGDTAVIGGIYTRNTSETYAEVPFFSKIPIIGWLFKKKRNEDRRAELLVFITPRIVNRESALISDAAATISSTPEAPAISAPGESVGSGNTSPATESPSSEGM
ncbi:MAG: type IV pilus secretin PilQ [Deltaproteobacteria bacterium]|nr:type IV pilus secretin PilQ [Deltaproteobacteria bacterium]